MKTRDFYFNLPGGYIAQHPADKRDDARLMVVDRSSGKFTHHHIYDLPALLPSKSLLVLNNSKVRKARLFGKSGSGGRVEFLLLRRTGERTWDVLMQKAKKQKPGKLFRFPENIEGEIVLAPDNAKQVRFSAPLTEEYFERNGHMPLPPYIRREDCPADSERYQTVFSESTGSVAAPTAGLHFTPELFQALEKQEIDTCTITLHVGIGTFLPIRSENVEDHTMHEEEYFISEETADKINAARKDGNTIVAVGTTSVRTLEASFRTGNCTAGRDSTSLFIYPGYTFTMVDHLLTNFHTPESSLLVLVSAFAGKELIREAYQEAVREKYRFFSYGDAMLIR